MAKITAESFLSDFMLKLKARDAHELEFHQAVFEVVETLAPFLLEQVQYLKAKILDRLIEPERVVTFRVPWVDDRGEVHVNRGYRVEMNSAIGPYKGGLRFHPTVNLSILKFLAFEQVFKNSLTTLSMGGGKGGADFEPKGKSDDEVMRFCQSFMTELSKHIGPYTDVPAGDIGVGGREIGFLFGQYKRIRNEFTGVLTGKGIGWGGSLIRPEATGYGNVYFAEEILNSNNDSIRGKVITVSGSGNVAQFTTEKCIELGAKVVTMSDSSGFIHDKEGINSEKLKVIMELKNIGRARISEYLKYYPKAKYYPEKRPWGIKCAIALPSATQNEIDEKDAKTLIKNGCKCVAEGANMPSTNGAIHWYRAHKILFAPGKASNAGGVAVSGLEMTQNAMRLAWTREEVDNKLKLIMKSIHETCVKYGTDADGFVNYERGANIGGFVKVANAMMAQGIV